MCVQAPFPRRRPFQRYNYGMNRRDYYEPGFYQPRGYGRGGPRGGGRGRGRGGRGQGGYRRTNKVGWERLLYKNCSFFDHFMWLKCICCDSMQGSAGPDQFYAEFYGSLVKGFKSRY